MAKLLVPRVGRSNPTLRPGVHRFGRSKMYHKKGLRYKKEEKVEKKASAAKNLYKEKPVGGDANGGKRLVLLKKTKRYHPTGIGNRRRVVVRPGVASRVKLRKSLVPGTVLIMLAGWCAGKRVVFLKQLASGLLLVTGPFKLNSVPLRRVNQQYVIATSTRLDIANLTVPEHVNDSYFRRDKKAAFEKRKEQNGNIFVDQDSKTGGGYAPSEARKADQVLVDKQILEVIKSQPDKKTFMKYMSASFSLSSGQFPHKMKF